jgi:transcriptional regulator with XRE-family HTH domain
MNLKKIRKDANMTQKEMASALNIPYATYLSYEYGHRNPSRFAKEHISGVIATLNQKGSASIGVVRNLITKKEDKNGTSSKLY